MTLKGKTDQNLSWLQIKSGMLNEETEQIIMPDQEHATKQCY